MLRRNRKSKANESLAELGLPNIPDLDLDDPDVAGSDEDDSNLESELQALLSGKDPGRPVRKPKKELNIMDVERMANECLKDDDVDEDENLSDDEDLLGELQAIAGNHESESDADLHKPNESDDLPKPISSPDSVVSTLSERLNLYKEAQAAAKQCGDSSKVRRYGRAIKTLEGQLKSAKSGHDINEEDIPPVVSIPKSKAPTGTDKDIEPAPVPSVVPSRPAPVPPRPAPELSEPEEQSASFQSSTVSSKLTGRRDQYKMAALRAKKCGDNETALMYVKIAKKFDAVIEAEKSGQPVDLSNMPPAPPKYLEEVQNTAEVANPSARQPQVQSEETQSSGQAYASGMEKAALEAANEPVDPELFSAPPPPTNILEALTQRLEKYCSTRDEATSAGNKSKARRLQRIEKQYEEAIKCYKAGKPVDFANLPTPPGFAPIPVGAGEDDVPAKEVGPSEVPPKVVKPPAPTPPKAVQQPKSHPEGPSSSERPPKVQRANTSILDKQLLFLLERQNLFRQAALESKKKGDIQQAKEYLRMSRGFDAMIEATKNGLPINATTIPTPPQLDADYVIIDASEVFTNETVGTCDNLFSTLEKELKRQIELCEKNKAHFLSVGDVSSASKFERLGLESKKDSVVIQYLSGNQEPVPKFHYETRLFSVVQCNTDLADGDIEITIERGINFPGKAETLDSYVKVEFPVPNDAPQRAKTHTVYDTNNPTFQEAFKFEINRKSRSQVRQIRRHTLKCEVWSKGGFFRGDTVLGTVNIKLAELESKCTIHNSFDLCEGRKPCGGRLEVKIRLRDPLISKQVEEVREKWLVISNS